MPSKDLTDSRNVDVLVVGAGPAGLMSAFALARAGVKVRIVDQRYFKLSSGEREEMKIL